MDTTRRCVIRGAGLAILGAAVHARAQRSAGLPRIGYLTPGADPREQASWLGMRDLGYVEGKTIVVDRRSAEGDFSRLPALAAEIVASRPDVFVAVLSAAALAARQATSTIPIVMVGATDPVSHEIRTGDQSAHGRRPGHRRPAGASCARGCGAPVRAPGVRVGERLRQCASRTIKCV